MDCRVASLLAVTKLRFMVRLQFRHRNRPLAMTALHPREATTSPASSRGHYLPGVIARPPGRGDPWLHACMDCRASQWRNHGSPPGRPQANRAPSGGS